VDVVGITSSTSKKSP